MTDQSLSPALISARYVGAARVFVVDDGERFQYVSSGIGYVLAEHIEINDCEDELDEVTITRLAPDAVIKITVDDEPKVEDVPGGGYVVSDEKGWHIAASAAQWAVHVEGKEHGVGRYSLFNAEQISSSVH